jgi:transposase InsO family protein
VANVLERQFEAPAPNRKWVADFTYIWTAEGWLYVAAVARPVLAPRGRLVDELRIPAKADSESGRLRTAFRSIADSNPVIADSGSRRRLQRFTPGRSCQVRHA